MRPYGGRRRGLPRLRRGQMVAAGALVAMTALAGCSGGDDDAPAGEKDERSRAAASASAAAQAEESLEQLTTVAEPAAAIAVGSRRYASPCRLLAPADVHRLIGPMRAGATVDQEYVEASPAPGKLRRDDGVLATRCTIHFSDKARHYLEVEVDQFAKPQAARKAWERIRYLGTGRDSAELAGEEGLEWLAEMARDNERDIGGKIVAGAPHLLYVPGHHDFVTYAGSMLVRMRYDTVVGAFQDKPLTPRQYADQAPKMARAATIIQLRAADASLSQAPMPTVLGSEKAAGETAYLEACRVLDAETAQMLMRHAPNEPTKSESLYLDTATIRRGAAAEDPYPGTPANSCEREVKTDGPWGYAHGTARLEIRYVEKAEQAQQVLQDWIVVRTAGYAKRDQYTLADLQRAQVVTRRGDTAADDAFVYDTQGRISDYRATAIYVRSGPYLMRLEGGFPQKGEEVAVEPDAYLPVIERIVDRLPEQRA